MGQIILLGQFDKTATVDTNDWDGFGRTRLPSTDMPPGATDTQLAPLARAGPAALPPFYEELYVEVRRRER